MPRKTNDDRRLIEDYLPIEEVGRLAQLVRALR